jgi:hypothetical protein
MSKEQKWGNIFNRGLIRGRQVEVVCGERPNHKRENYAGEHDQHFVYWCILISDDRIVKGVPKSGTRNNGKMSCEQGDAAQEMDKSRVCAVADAFCTYPRTVMVHFQDASSTDRAVMCPFRFGRPTFSTPPIRRRNVIISNERFPQPQLILICLRPVDSRRSVGITGVSDETYKERREYHENQRIRNQEMCNKEVWSMQSL